MQYSRSCFGKYNLTFENWFVPKRRIENIHLKSIYRNMMKAIFSSKINKKLFVKYTLSGYKKLHVSTLYAVVKKYDIFF